MTISVRSSRIWYLQHWGRIICSTISSTSIGPRFVQKYRIMWDYFRVGWQFYSGNGSRTVYISRSLSISFYLSVSLLSLSLSLYFYLNIVKYANPLKVSQKFPSHSAKAFVFLKNEQNKSINLLPCILMFKISRQCSCI